MRDRLVAKRYANAFIDFAAPELGIDRCVDEMKSLKWLMRENKDFGQFIRAPGIPRGEKIRVIDVALEKFYSVQTRTFIKYLIDKGRVVYLMDIADEVRLGYAHVDVVDVVLRTTFPLELDLITRIKERIELRVKGKINLYLELDPDLLGGVQISIGNTIIDGSVRNRLKTLKKNLLQTQVSK